MNISDETYEEGINDWLHRMPLDELPPIINLIARRFRNKEYDEPCARAMLEKFRGMITQWKANNAMIAEILSKIPDE